MTIRDQTLDNLRGLAMLQVILVHVIEWSGFASDHIGYTFTLFEMPIFFFVAGAVYKPKESYKAYIAKKAARILKPYYIYAAVCATATIAYELYKQNHNWLLLAVILLSWLFPTSFRVFPLHPITQIPYLNSALWFPMVYLSVMAILPFVPKRHYTGTVLTGIFIISCHQPIEFVRYITFYLFWSYIGLHYKKLKTNRKMTGLISVLSLTALCMLEANGITMDMHENKFPPNLAFGVFTMFTTFAIISMTPWIDKFAAHFKTVFKIFSTESITIYYWESFAFLLTVPVTIGCAESFPFIADSELLQILICFALTVPTCMLFVKIKRAVTEFIRRSRSVT